MLDTNDQKEVYQMNLKEENYPISGDKFLSIFFYLTNDKKTVYRSYDKLIKVMAEVGGLLNALYVFSKIMFYPCIQIILYLELLKNYYFPEAEAKEKTEKKTKIKLSIITNNFIKSDPKFKKKSNTKIPFLKQVKMGFCKLFGAYYFNYKSEKPNEIIPNLAFENLLSQIEISNMLRKFYEIDILKTCIFDKKQLELFNSMPIIIKKTTRKESINQISHCKNLLTEIRNRDFKSEIDKKLIDLFN